MLAKDKDNRRDWSAPRRESVLRKWRRLSHSDRLLLCEAMTVLTIASLAIEILPFRTVARLAAGRMASGAVPDTDRVSIDRQVRWAVMACARRVPWKAVCFQQGLAAHWMLRRRGIASILYYGAAQKADELQTHVWVRDGDTDIVGCENAAGFSVLATFPGAKP